MDGGETPRLLGGADGVVAATDPVLGRGGRPLTGECIRTAGGAVSWFAGTREVERLEELDDEGILISMRSCRRNSHSLNAS